MPLALNTPVVIAEPDTLGVVKIKNILIDVDNSCITISAAYGNVVDGDFIESTNKPPFSVSLINQPEHGVEGAPEHTPAVTDYNDFVSNNATLYDQIKAKAYEVLTSKGYAGTVS